MIVFTFSNKLEGADAGKREKTIYLSQLKSGRYIVFSASSMLEIARLAIFEKVEKLKIRSVGIRCGNEFFD